LTPVYARRAPEALEAAEDAAEAPEATADLTDEAAPDVIEALEAEPLMEALIDMDVDIEEELPVATAPLAVVTLPLTPRDARAIPG
jgi:hypothetical protein